jgi:hypothetical protein
MQSTTAPTQGRWFPLGQGHAEWKNEGAKGEDFSPGIGVISCVGSQVGCFECCCFALQLLIITNTSHMCVCVMLRLLL